MCDFCIFIACCLFCRLPNSFAYCHNFCTHTHTNTPHAYTHTHTHTYSLAHTSHTRTLFLPVLFKQLSRVQSRAQPQLSAAFAFCLQSTSQSASLSALPKRQSGLSAICGKCSMFYCYFDCIYCVCLSCIIQRPLLLSCSLSVSVSLPAPLSTVSVCWQSISIKLASYFVCLTVQVFQLELSTNLLQKTL